jgi:hypothetical protein
MCNAPSGRNLTVDILLRELSFHNINIEAIGGALTKMFNNESN